MLQYCIPFLVSFRAYTNLLGLFVDCVPVFSQVADLADGRADGHAEPCGSHAGFYHRDQFLADYAAGFSSGAVSFAS